MQTDILQNIICTADPAVIAKDWEVRERIGYYPEGFHLEPPLLERELERLEREISDFQKRIAALQPGMGCSKLMMIADPIYCNDAPDVLSHFYEKRDFGTLLARAVSIQVPDKLEENAPLEYYDKIFRDWDSALFLPYPNINGNIYIDAPLEEIVGIEVFPPNIERHGKDIFVSNILWEISFDDRYIHELPEWETDPEIEAAKKKADKEYEYTPLSREEEREMRWQKSKDAARSALAQIAEFRQLYKEFSESPARQ